jgi:hypothetical protein
MTPITLILTRRGDQIERKFVPSLARTDFGKALKALNPSRRKLEREFPGVKLPKLDPNSAIFQKWQDVPWYLDKIGRELFENRDNRYRLKVKACDGFLYIRLQIQRADGKWELLIRPFFQELPLPKSPDKMGIDRGFADTLLFIAPKLKAGVRNAGEIFKWYDIDIKASCTKFDSRRQQLTLAFEPEVRVFRGEVDEDKKSIDYRDLKGSPGKVLVVSKNVRAAIGELAEVWDNPLPRSVLLSAWTGSGKEVLKDLFLYACGLTEDRVMEFAAPDLAASGSHGKQIFDKMKCKKLFSVVAKDEELRSHCVLFLDEIHHNGVQQLRSGLLRSMEIDEISDGQNTVKTNRLTYLFAASNSPEQLRELPPPDFWNRIQYNVVMNHPLSLPKDERAEAFRQYFCLFWRKAAETRTRNDKDKDVETTKNIRLLQGKGAMKKISKRFVDVLGSPLIPMVSMRTIRTIVARLFGRALYLSKTEQPEASDLADRVSDQLEDWANEICRHIVPESRPEGLF